LNITPLENFFSPLSSAENVTVFPGAGIVSPILSVLNITDQRYPRTVALSLSTARRVISIASQTRAVVGAVISIFVAEVAPNTTGEKILLIKKRAISPEKSFFIVQME
jgi:hypothetical protein